MKLTLDVNTQLLIVPYVVRYVAIASYIIRGMGNYSQLEYRYDVYMCED